MTDSAYADCKPGGSLLQLLNQLHENSVACYSSPSLSLVDVNSPQDFYSKIDNLQESYFEALALFRKRPLENHHYFWIFTIDSLVDHLIKFKHFYDQRLLNNLQYDDNPIIDNIGVKLDKLSGDLGEMLAQFTNSPTLDLGKFVLIDHTSNIVFNKFAGVMIKSLELLFIEKSGESQYIDNSTMTLNVLTKLLFNFYEYISYLKDAGHQDLIYKAFPILTEFVKVTYIAGESQLIIPFLSPFGKLSQPIISPKFPIELIPNSRVQLSTLIDFYRFTAFNLVTLSVSQQGSIDDSYNKQADFYFKILFGFPNLRTRLYSTLNSSSEPRLDTQTDNQIRLITLIERQEISLMYILNYLLGLRNLTQIVSPDNTLLYESSFLVISLSSCMKSELYESASRSQSSRSSSVVSLPRSGPSSAFLSSTVPANKPSSRAKYQFLSSILVHGSYKEKLTLIVNFVSHFSRNSLDLPIIISTHNLNSDGQTRENNFQHLLANIDKSVYPGKVFYAETIFKIIQLLKALGIKHLVESGGFNPIPERVLNSMFSCNNSIESTCSVKRVLDVIKTITDDNDTILHFTLPLSNNDNFDDEKFVAKQMDTIRLTKQLKLAALKLDSAGGDI